ncbi:GM19515 [Drosophila sechellia]|uniref:GM19515 n=1 Tax=Drosophila sechellia TaxID=7238 RepID=B4I6X3_DROSE|nr:GM19515 [Drosophila sechellia]
MSPLSPLRSCLPRLSSRLHQLSPNIQSLLCSNVCCCYIVCVLYYLCTIST